MKSGVKTKFRSGDGRNAFRSWPRRTTVGRFVRRASAPSSVGLRSAGSRLPRIHSTVRFGERSQAHRGDSGSPSFLSLEASSFSFFFFFKASSLCPCLARSRVIGELSGQGTSQLRGLSRAVRPRRTFGFLPRLPVPRTAAGSLFSPAAFRTALAARGFRGGLGLGSEKSLRLKLPPALPEHEQGVQDFCAGC